MDDTTIKIVVEGLSDEGGDEVRRDRPAGKERQDRPTESVFGQILNVIDKLRGTLGGLFGQLVGSLLDIASAMHRAPARPLHSMEMLPGVRVPPGLEMARAPVKAQAGEPWRQDAQGNWLPPTAATPYEPGLAVPAGRWTLPPTKAVPSQPGTAGIPFQPSRMGPGGYGPPSPAVAAVPPKPAVAGLPATPGVKAPPGPESAVMAASIAAIAVAAGTAIKKWTLDTTESAGRFSAAMISASDSPVEFMGQMGAMTRTMTEGIPIVGHVLAMFGSMGTAAAAVAAQLDGMVDRYMGFSPELSQGQALVDIRQQLGDFRRAQEAAPALLEYMRARSDLQQKVEDMKIRLLTQMAPTVVRGMELFEMVLPHLEMLGAVVNGMANAIFDLLRISRRTEQRLDDMNSLLNEMNAPGAAELPTNIIRREYPFRHAQAESTRPIG